VAAQQTAVWEQQAVAAFVLSQAAGIFNDKSVQQTQKYLAKILASRLNVFPQKLFVPRDKTIDLILKVISVLPTLPGDRLSALYQAKLRI